MTGIVNDPLQLELLAMLEMADEFATALDKYLEHYPLAGNALSFGCELSIRLQALVEKMAIVWELIED